MKNLKIIIVLLMLSISVGLKAAENYLNTSDVITFDNTEYFLGWSSHPSESRFLQEYFPRGQTPDDFTDMLSVWLFIGDISASQWIDNMKVSYQQRKSHDPCANYQVYENDDEYMMDCLLSESDGKHVSAVEFNVYRCKDIEVEGKHGLLICFYSGKAQGENVTPFLKQLRDRRLDLIQAMIAFEYPAVSISSAISAI